MIFYILVAFETKIAAQEYEAVSQIALYRGIVAGLCFQYNTANPALLRQLLDML